MFIFSLQHFRTQGIDGSTLILLKEDHLVTTMKMRLGSVLKFKAALAKKMGSCPICLHCVHCHNEMTNETTKEPTSPPNTSTTPIEESNSEANPWLSITSDGKKDALNWQLFSICYLCLIGFLCIEIDYFYKNVLSSVWNLM